MLQAILNKSWKQHPTKQQLYGHQPPVTNTIKIRLTRHAGHYWRSRDEFVSDVLLWNPSLGQAKVGRPARTYIQQLCADTGCSPEDLPKAMVDREGWRKRIKYIRADSATWWRWWWWCLHTVKWSQGLLFGTMIFKPWCNGYGRRKWTRRHEFKSWTRLIAFHIALIPLGKVWIQLFSVQLWVNSRAD